MPKPNPCLALSLAICATVLAAAPASAASQPAPAASSPFDGVWDRVGSITFDPTLPPGKLDEPPYNAEFAQRYKAILDAERAGRPEADPTASCLFAGMPRMMNLALPMEIAVTSGRVFMMFEWNSEIRRIYTDGRKHPEDPDPSFQGHSIGHWEGDRLKVETVALRSDTRFNAAGAPHSDAMKIYETIWLEDANTLKDEIRIEDPKAFTKPYVVVKTYRRQPGWEIQEYVCAENNRNPVVNGVTGATVIPSEKK